ncbi:ABC transporter permease [Gordonia amarae]|uniref:YrbE family protein n=2 Tax=Gordonia amarae TaxID=36821 RepID=G7GQR1_9ACTN|nr:ABC transporter permease [Gordonia amarae]MCS3877645.1 phospholipid/cholesterol/gamma-HCH transport system permease protein [Gordonia amarae]QHN16357.1 ABC transporter permease [Gordonia amarae]QHN20926.1 ABC transporter permease [Gordonia amarae]QHN29777.1 ABC transporter permease [Gordonia amarae]QHN38552.1 ABC transporter permease [Gordonia amarae]
MPLAAVQSFGRTVRLGARTPVIAVVDMIGGRFPYREAIVQAWFLLSITVLPALLMAVPFGVIIAVQIGGLTNNLGASSMAGAVGGMGVIQQGAPMAASLLLGGAGASAITADLGARTVREEIDAMRVLGIDPTRRLVAPRMVAMILVAPVLSVLIIVIAVASSFVVSIVGQGVVAGSYWQSFGSYASLTDLWICLLKSVIFGFVVVVIAARRGLEAAGGSRGVADAVNASVVLGVVVCMVVNVVITQITALFIPIQVI